MKKRLISILSTRMAEDRGSAQICFDDKDLELAMLWEEDQREVERQGASFN